MSILTLLVVMRWHISSWHDDCITNPPNQSTYDTNVIPSLPHYYRGSCSNAPTLPCLHQPTYDCWEPASVTGNTKGGLFVLVRKATLTLPTCRH